MAFTVNDFRNIINQLRPIDYQPGLDFKTTGLAAAMQIIRLMMELAIYIFLVALLASGLIYLFALGSPDRTQTAKKSFIYAFVGLLVVISAYGLLSFVLQQIGFLEQAPTPAEVTARIFKFAFGAAIAGFMLILLLAGTRYIFSLGNEDEAATARRQIVDALIGLALTFGAWGIGRAVIKLVGLIG